MASARYLGNTPALKYSNLEQQTFSSPTGTSFTLNNEVSTAVALDLYINNVKQNPTSYTVAGTSLTLSQALVSGDEMYCIYYGKVVGTIAVPDNSVNASKVADNAITGAKIAMGSDAQGDVLYYNGTDYVRLAKGTAGQVLKINSGATAPEWGTGAGLDVVQTWTKGQRGEVTALSDGANISIDFNNSNNFSITLGGNRTLNNPSNCTAGQSGSIFVTQDGTGSRTLAYQSYWKWAGGTAPTLSTAANAVDRIDYVVQSSSVIHAVATSDVK
tara:strand:- start:5294 stop:6109 length:816 start_codon:yes stop_codon:yes gene_type:complete